MSVSSTFSGLASLVVVIALSCGRMPTAHANKWDLPQRPSCDLRPNPDRSVEAADQKLLSICQAGNCGSNSPEVNRFPISGLHPEGCINADGFALDVDSFDRGNSQCDPKGTAKLLLDIEYTMEYTGVCDSPKAISVQGQDKCKPSSGTYRFFARDPKSGSKLKCTGAQLVGAKFDVISNRHRMTLLINHMATTKFDYVIGDGPEAEPRAEQRVVYLISEAGDPGNSLCAQHSHDRKHVFDYHDPESAQLGALTYPSKDLWKIDPSELSAYAVIIPGPVYDNKGDYLKNAYKKIPARWFNIACAGDALAQSDLEGVVPLPSNIAAIGEAAANERATAIHMFAAQYRDGTSATINGTPIAWRMPGRSSRSYVPNPSLLVEAQWNSGGASCVSLSRLWMSNRVISVKLPVGQSASTPTTEKDFLEKVVQVGPCTSLDPKKLTSYVQGHAP